MKAAKNRGNKGAGGGKGGQWSDHLTEKAKSQGYPARSVYKLEEIQNKFRIMKAGDLVLDLGCSPGSWLLLAAKLTGDSGKVMGIDLKPVETPLPPNVTAVQDDILKLENPGFLAQPQGFDLVMSDMAPATTGRKDVDAARSVALCRMALAVALKNLKTNGNFICKIFQGNEFKAFEKEVGQSFQECRIFKPESCRKQSKEIYIIAKGKR